MNEKHLTYFKVENFKRFESFEMNNIGQFNLILGDNNVGKTSVLEALLFDLEDADRFRDNLLTVLYEFRKVAKNIENPLQLFVTQELENNNSFNIFIEKEKPIKIDLSNFIYVLEDNNEDIKNEIKTRSIHYDYDRTYEEIYEVLIGIENNYNNKTAKENTPYIPFHIGYDNDLITYFSKFIQFKRNTRKEIIEALKVIIPTIESLEISMPEINSPILLVAQSNKNEMMPLSMFGEGTIKLFRILMKIVVHRGKRLMIDEIDAGIHFKKFKDFWRTILLAAKQNDVQIFATTHNEECLEAFKEVLEETKEISEGIKMVDFQQDARSFTLRELPNGQVKAYTYPYEQFKTMLENGNNIRGGSYEK
jgi:AAA15 family ATPase/GTPase